MRIISPILSSRHRFKKHQKSCSYGQEKLLVENSFKPKIKAVIRCIKSTRISPEQIMAFNRIISGIRNKHVKKKIKKMRKKFLININLNFSVNYSRKPKGIRMGKGKGNLLNKAIGVRKGECIVEISYRYGSRYLDLLLNEAKNKLSKNKFELFFL